MAPNSVFPKILKQKKILTFIFLFLVFTGFTIPYVARANWNPACWAIWGQPTAGTFWGDYCYFSESNNEKVMDVVNDTLDEAIKPVFNGVVLAVGMILIIISGTLSGMAAGLLSWVMSPSFIKVPYTGFENTAIANGWPMVRDLANMIVVLGFVIIGIATTLRIQDYQAKKLLPKLIIAALLINFSLLICGIFIDGANLVTTYFAKSGGFMQKSLTIAIGEQVSSLWQNYKTGDTTTVLGAATGLLFFNIMAFVIFMLFFFLFMFRYMALWTLVILSPLAFVFFVFPFTKKFFDMWWSNFLQWCIIGIPASFFLWIADKITSGFSNPSAPTGGTPSLGAYLLPGCFLIIGFLFSLKTSAMGAGAAIGAAKWSGGKAWGGAKAGGSALDKLTGNRASSAGKAISSKMGLALEGMGLRAQGTTSQKSGAEMDKTKKRVGTQSIENQVRGAQRGRIDERVANIENLTEKGELHRLGNVDQQAQAIALAESHDRGQGRESTVRKNAVDHNYLLAAHDANRINQVETSKGITTAQATDEVVMGQLKTALPKMSGEQIRHIDSTHVAGAARYNFVKENFNPRMIEQLQTATDPALQAGMRTHIGAVGTANTLLDDIHIAIGARNMREADRLQKIHDAINRYC